MGRPAPDGHQLRRARRALFTTIIALGGVVMVPGSASAELLNGCPPKWVLIDDDQLPGGADKDRNGDDLVCHHEAHIAVGTVFIDNKISDSSAEGVAEDGSIVLVDTATGDLLGS